VGFTRDLLNGIAPQLFTFRCFHALAVCASQLILLHCFHSKYFCTRMYYVLQEGALCMFRWLTVLYEEIAAVKKIIFIFLFHVKKEMIDWSPLGLDEFEKRRVTMSTKCKDNRHMNVARFSALRAGRLCLPHLEEINQVVISDRGHSAALRIKSPKNPKVTYQVSNPQTSRLQSRVLIKCATAYLDKE